ncbi:hypothetical protein D3C86_1387870 [compost metagenome]
MSKLLDFGFGGAGGGQVLEGVNQRAHDSHAKAAFFERVFAVGLLNIAACDDGDVFSSNVDAAGVADEIACGPSRDNVAACNQNITSCRQNDVAARGAHETARIALRGSVYGLQGFGITALVRDSEAPGREPAFLYPFVMAFTVGVRPGCHCQITAGIHDKVVADKDLRGVERKVPSGLKHRSFATEG